jgi:hypothetical protein
MTEPTNIDDNAREGESIIKPLPQDNTTPFSQPGNADGVGSGVDDDTDVVIDDNGTIQSARLDDTHQATDSASDIDTQELYDEGLAGAAEAEEPNAGNTVVGYDPEKDQRKQ